MKVITQKEQFNTALDAFDVEDSIGLCFYSGLLDTSFIVAARQAGYVCDRLVVVNLAENLTQTQKSILNRINVDVLFEGQETSFQLQSFLRENSKAMAIILTSLFSFMPLAVSVPQNNVPLIQVLKKLQDDFGNVFELIVKPTPVALLNNQQKTLRSAMVPCLEAIQNGESEVDALKVIIQQSLKAHDLHFIHAHFYDVDTFEECYGVVSPMCYVSIECELAGQKVRDILTISDI